MQKQELLERNLKIASKRHNKMEEEKDENPSLKRYYNLREGLIQLLDEQATIVSGNRYKSIIEK